jgi:hypothetical protein
LWLQHQRCSAPMRPRIHPTIDPRLSPTRENSL